MKSHFASEFGGTACHRGKITTDNVWQVTCGLCKNTPEFVEHFEAAVIAKEKAFWAQTPVEIGNPWTHENLVCRECGNTTFRDRGRDLFTFWYMCANCGKLQGYPTETGMCS